MSNSISILIVTKNRPKKLYSAIYSITQQSELPHEVLIVDQSSNNESKVIVQNFKDLNIKYFQQNIQNKSVGANFGIGKVTGSIIAFTDDDCVLSKNWVKVINQKFSENINLDLLFGKTVPFLPEKNSDLFCPSVFQKSKSSSIKIDSFTKHSIDVGIGNNMIIKKSFFEDGNYFAEWLGPGSRMQAAEDAELIIKAILQEKTIDYSNDLIVFHNRWVNKQELLSNELQYIKSEFACYGLYALRGYGFAKQVLKKHVSNTMSELLHSLVNKRISLQYTLKKIWSEIQGSLFAVKKYYSE